MMAYRCMNVLCGQLSRAPTCQLCGCGWMKLVEVELDSSTPQCSIPDCLNPGLVSIFREGVPFRYCFNHLLDAVRAVK